MAFMPLPTASPSSTRPESDRAISGGGIRRVAVIEVIPPLDFLMENRTLTAPFEPAAGFYSVDECEKDAVLHVAFTGVGIASSRWLDNYEPRLNASAYLMAGPDASDWLSGDHFYYGADACGDTAWSVPADPKYRYSSMKALVDGVGDLAECYDAAILAIAQRIVRQLRQHL